MMRPYELPAATLSLTHLSLRPRQPHDHQNGSKLPPEPGNQRASPAASRTREPTGQCRQCRHSRVVIEQAKGKLTERLGLDMGEGFRPLCQHAKDRDEVMNQTCTNSTSKNRG